MASLEIRCTLCKRVVALGVFPSDFVQLVPVMYRPVVAAMMLGKDLSNLSGVLVGVFQMVCVSCSSLDMGASYECKEIPQANGA